MGGGIGLIGFRSPSADGRKNVAHGDSRGEKARTMRLKSPGGATELSWWSQSFCRHYVAQRAHCVRWSHGWRRGPHSCAADAAWGHGLILVPIPSHPRGRGL